MANSNLECSNGGQMIKTTIVKFSDIVKHPTMRLDAKYWIKKKNKKGGKSDNRTKTRKSTNIQGRNRRRTCQTKNKGRVFRLEEKKVKRPKMRHSKKMMNTHLFCFIKL